MNVNVNWQEHGIQFGTLSEQHCEEGGIWLVGDKWSETSYAYSKAVKYKSWIARDDKYGPNAYPFKNRRLTSEREFVLVTKNTLILKIKDTFGSILYHTLNAGQAVEIAPTSSRSWLLPHNSKSSTGQNEARGCTLLWNDSAMLVNVGQPAITPGFLFQFWSANTVDWDVDILNRHVESLGLTKKYVEIFQDCLVVRPEKGLFSVPAGGHAYIRVGIPISFGTLTPDTCGIVLYYR